MLKKGKNHDFIGDDHSYVNDAYSYVNCLFLPNKAIISQPLRHTPIEYHNLKALEKV